MVERYSRSTPNQWRLYRGIAHSLQEFGYPSVTAEMIREIAHAYYQGKREHQLPHGVIGLIVGGQLDKASRGEL